MDEKSLEAQAIQELLSEAKRGKERSETMGPSGWQKNLVPVTNKRFLQRTVASVLLSQKRKEAQSANRKRPASPQASRSDEKQRDLNHKKQPKKSRSDQMDSGRRRFLNKEHSSNSKTTPTSHHKSRHRSRDRK